MNSASMFRHYSVRVCVLLAVVFGGFAVMSGAQVQEEIIRVRRVDAFGARTKVQTPDYQVRNVPRSAKPAGDWYMLTIEYDTAPEWIDELVFQHYVVTQAQVDGATVYFLFKNVVRYGDIERGRAHLSTVFLRPNVIKRYGNPVAVGYEILHQGQIVASGQFEQGGLRVPENWWNNNQVTERMRLMQGYLLDRSQTPFALVNIDDYEVIK